MDAKSESQSVRVAVNIRPLITPELVVGCSDCISVTPGEPQVQIGSHSFTFDYVYRSSECPSSRIYEDCVDPLVDALFHGYNATVLAYGQTGSGKTYTMGTNYNGESTNGIIPKVMHTIFKRVEDTNSTTQFLIRVSFIEIFKEEVFDLLESTPRVYPKADGNAKAVGPSRAPIQIRETANGGISLAAVTEAEVTSQEEMASFLLRGSACRATGSVNMNSQSSRSHAIFTITMEQKKLSTTVGGAHDDAADDILCAKLHLVDLAGSERAKKTGADGMRLQEGIHINKGLLALGNVISALGDDKKRKEGRHVPYRDSKLTRLLQDSLGGNSKSVMIACVSPADTNAEETLNTLKYANRVRNIQNKAIVNRDPVTTQMQSMKNQIEQLQAELLYVKGDSSTPFEELQILKQKIALLETSNADLQSQFQEQKVNFEHLTKQATEAQNVDVLKTYVSKVQELEGELLRLRRLDTSKHSELIDYMDLDANVLHTKRSLFPESNLKAAVVSESSSAPGFQALMQALEHELEVTVRVHEVRCEYERKKEERLKMAKEVAELKDEANIAKQSNLSHFTQTMSPGARNSRISALENMLATSSNMIVSMASQLSEAEEREQAFSGRDRWNSVWSLADAKSIMNYLFNLASSSRCRLWDKEVDCKEGDTEIKSLKEKIVNLIRQVEMLKAEHSRMEKFKKLYMSKSFKKKSINQDSSVMEDGEGRMYDLRPKGLRNSISYNSSGNIDELLEDMEISESENSDIDETDTEWVQSDDFKNELDHRRRQNAKKRNSKFIMETETQKSSPNEGTNPPFKNRPCTCSKGSSCKTDRCECRATWGCCSMSCNCNPKKCCNRAAEPSKKQESSMVEPMKLRLSRAMRSANSNANPNPLRDRNSEASDDSTVNKESGPKSRRHHLTPKEKENQGQ